MKQYWRTILIFCVIFISGMGFSVILVNHFTQTLEIQEQIRIGNLLTHYPDQEKEIVKNFYSIPLKDAIKKGQQLEKKYGYIANKRPTNDYLAEYRFGMILFLAVLWLLVMLTMWWVFRKFRKQLYQYEQLESNFQEVNDYLIHTKYQLENEEQTTKALITDISHQLKTPIASLKMNYDILKSENYTSLEKETFLNQGQYEFQKLETFLNSLLNISHLETKMINIRPTRQLLKETLTNAINNIYMKAFNQQIDIELSEFKDIYAKFDKRWTEEAFINLLDNAIKYSPKESLIMVNVKPMFSYVLIEFIDQGIGISSHEINDIFKRFYRGQHQISTEGSGVGLYLVRQIIEEQNGSIRVKRNQSRGATFQVMIPFSDD